MKRSPQVSVKSSSVSSELQSINTAGRAFSQGRGAVGCSPCNSKGTQIKQCNLYYYSLQKEGSSVSADKPPLSRSLSGAAADQLYNTEISACSPKRPGALCSSCSLPKADMTLPMATINVFPSPSLLRKDSCIQLNQSH